MHGLLGLFPARVQGRLTVNYRRSLREVVGDVVKACLEGRQGSKLRIDLSFFRLFPPFVEENPSDRDLHLSSLMLEDE